MRDLLSKARATKAQRNAQYPDWRETAHRYHEGDPGRYPADMIRAKLARDPDCRREDTRVDIVNYLAMLDELDEPTPYPIFAAAAARKAERDNAAAVQRRSQYETGPETVDRLKRERNGGMGAEFE